MRWQGLWQKVRRRPGVRRNTIFVAFLLLSLLITSATIEQIDRNHQLEAQVAERQRQQEFLEQQIANQRLENQFYQTDYFLELEARRQFGLVSDGESVIVLQGWRIDEQLAGWEGSFEAPPTEETPSNWQLWWQFFWGREPLVPRDP